QSREALLGLLETGIAEVTDLLKELPDASWGRPGQHPDDGRRSIKQHARAMRAHFDEHLAQLGKMA
ncbi:MAG: DinB family protein, partial [Chloroflexota bacterium]